MEEWRSVVGWEGLYEVSSLGRVRRPVSRLGVGRVLASCLQKCSRPKWYRYVTLCNGPRRKQYSVHSLVAAAFIGPRPVGKNINHIDGVQGNNCSSNLEYTTPAENLKHASRMGLLMSGESHYKSKLRLSDVAGIRELSKRGFKDSAIQRLYPMVVRRTIRDVISHKSWSNQ